MISNRIRLLLAGLLAAGPYCAPGLRAETGAASGDASAGLSAHHAAAREAVREVLATREFSHLADDSGGWLELLGEWARRILEAARDFLASLPPFLRYAIVIWMLLTLLAILGHLIYVLAGALAAGRRRGAESAGSWRGEAALVLGVRDLDLPSVLGRARELLERREWGEALKHLHVALILRLEEGGLLRIGPWKTNADYIRELAPAPEAQETFRLATRSFEPVAYGGRTATREACDEMGTFLEALRRKGSP